MEEFFSKEWFDFTSYKWEGEGLYSIWGDGGYQTNLLKYIINEIEEDDEVYIENYIGKEYEENLYKELINSIK